MGVDVGIELLANPQTTPRIPRPRRWANPPGRRDVHTPFRE